MISVMHIGGSAEVYLPLEGITAVRAVPLEVPDEVAGRKPGPWRPARADEMVTGGGWTPAGWPLHRDEDGTWLTRDPGTGLLAQEDLWARPGSDAALAAQQREVKHVARLKAEGRPVREAQARLVAAAASRSLDAGKEG